MTVFVCHVTIRVHGIPREKPCHEDATPRSLPHPSDRQVCPKYGPHPAEAQTTARGEGADSGEAAAAVGHESRLA